MIAFRNLDVRDTITRLTFTLLNHDATDVFIELKNIDTGEVIGTADIPAPSSQYQNIVMSLQKPLPSARRLEVRVWNKGWNLISMGRVSIDKIILK